MTNTAAIVIPILLGLLGIFILWSLTKAFKIVREREVMVIERFGKFHSVLTAGVHFILPFVDRPKTWSYRFFTESPTPTSSTPHFEEKTNLDRISTQNEVLEFPKTHVITRDNAAVSLDAVLSYKVVNPKQMVYSVTNLPFVLSKLLQAQVRNVAGSLDIDQVIEESSSLNVLTGLMDNEATRWGVKIVFVKVQRVEAYTLSDVLAKKKNADLKNKEIIINAKAKKQTKVIESEGQRDSIIKKAEGQAQEILSTARGEAQAIINTANAEARSIKEIARAVGTQNNGIDVVQYLLGTKYIEALRSIVARPETVVQFMPNKTSFLQTVKEVGFNTVIPPVADK